MGWSVNVTRVPKCVATASNDPEMPTLYSVRLRKTRVHGRHLTLLEAQLRWAAPPGPTPPSDPYRKYTVCDGHPGKYITHFCARARGPPGLRARRETFASCKRISAAPQRRALLKTVATAPEGAGEAVAL
eukprot:5501675-Prymnesium_polylepis.1